MRLTLGELENGLESDKEYGSDRNCGKLLGRLLGKNSLKISQFSDAVRQQGYRNMLLRFWVGAKILPVYFHGSEDIEPEEFLEAFVFGPDSFPFSSLQTNKSDLYNFFAYYDLPLPAQWFPGERFSTNACDLFSEPRSSESFDILMKIYKLDAEKEKWELTGVQSLPSEEKSRLEQIKKIDSKIKLLKTEDDRLWTWCQSEDETSTTELKSAAVEEPPQSKEEIVAQNNTFVTPPGTEWYDIKIHFIDMNTIEITLGKGRKIRRKYTNIDCFYNKRTKNYRKAWMTLFLMTMHQGNIPENEKHYKKHISILRKNLQELFPELVGDPFHSHQRGQGWQPKLTLSYNSNLLKSASSL